jgi:nucleotide-binding universal stress UspA family protein
MPEAPEKLHLSKILLAIDGSENSTRATRTAVDLAKNFDATLIVLNVIAPTISIPAVAGADSVPIEYGSYYLEAEKRGSELVDGVATTARSEGVRVQRIVERSENTIAETIAASALNEQVDLIVIGTRGLGGIKKLLLGSVSSAVLSHAHCDVLIVR